MKVPVSRVPDGARAWRGGRAGAGRPFDAGHRTRVGDQAGRAAGDPAQRTLRRVDVRTVAAFSLLFNLALLVTVLVAGVVLWVAASVLGAIGSLDHLINQAFGYQSFHLVGSELFLITVLVGLILVALATVANVVMAVVYNLVSDVVGGLRFDVEDR